MTEPVRSTEHRKDNAHAFGWASYEKIQLASNWSLLNSN
jgi:hypothetical protein